MGGWCQGPRAATVTINYNDGENYSFTAAGRGRPKWTTLFSHGETIWSYSVGSDVTDELAGAGVADPDGNLFFTANAAQVINIFAHDILIGRLNADGTLGWLWAWSGKFQDYSRDSGADGDAPTLDWASLGVLRPVVRGRDLDEQTQSRGRFGRPRRSPAGRPFALRVEYLGE